MYAVDEMDEVENLHGIPRSDVGAPCPLLLADEFSTVVSFMLRDADCAAVEPLTDGSDEDGEVMAVIRFAGTHAHMFGPPNDEAFEGHPLATRGLHPYGSFRIRGSSWIRALERMNAVHSHHGPHPFRKLQHFVLSFHDSTFECVANELVVWPLSLAILN
jgi:hypothetical protein